MEVTLTPLDLEATREDRILLYESWLRDSEIMRCLESRFKQHDRESIRRYVAECKQTGFLFAIDAGSYGYVGNIRLTLNQVHRFAEVGLLIGAKDCWNKGIGSEAIREVSKFAFETLSLNKLTAGCYETNVGSIRAFQKAGFTIEGKLEKQYWFEGKYIADILLGKWRDIPALDTALSRPVLSAFTGRI